MSRDLTQLLLLSHLGQSFLLFYLAPRIRKTRAPRGRLESCTANVIRPAPASPWRQQGGTCGGITRMKHYFTGPGSVACGDAWSGLISEAARKEEAFPLKLAAQRWGNLGYSEGGCTCRNLSNAPSISSKIGSTYSKDLQDFPLMKNLVWLQNNECDRLWNHLCVPSLDLVGDTKDRCTKGNKENSTTAQPGSKNHDSFQDIPTCFPSNLPI